jgi:hypothetical protein
LRVGPEKIVFGVFSKKLTKRKLIKKQNSKIRAKVSNLQNETPVKTNVHYKTNEGLVLSVI